MPLCHNCRSDTDVSGTTVDTQQRELDRPCSRCGWYQAELERLKQMYVDGTVSLDVLEAMLEYYLWDCGGDGPTVLGRCIPSSVDSDVPPAIHPERHPEVKKYL